MFRFRFNGDPPVQLGVSTRLVPGLTRCWDWQIEV